jgi:transposase
MAAAYWCGIDWSENLNDVVVVDALGAVVTHIRVEETVEGVQQILQVLRGLSSSHRFSRKQVPIAIETSTGLLVAALRKAGQPVVAINPLVVARYRGRLNPTKQKADRPDARMLANILRTDGANHRLLHNPTQQAAAITVLARGQRRASHTVQYHRNQVRTHLRAYFPAALEAWAHLPDRYMRAEARAVLALAPTPAQAAALTKRKLADTLAAAGRFRLVDDHAIRLHTLFQEPRLRQPPQIEEAMGQQLSAMLALLDQACRTRDSLAELTVQAFTEHPQSKIYLSFPGCGAITGARLLAEIGDDPQRFASARGLRAYAGAAPLTWSSGATAAVSHRRIANKHLKGVGHTWAFSSLTRSPGCYAYFLDRRQRSDRYASSLRRLYSHLLGSLHYCLRHDELYREDIAFPTSPGASTDEVDVEE